MRRCNISKNSEKNGGKGQGPLGPGVKYGRGRIDRDAADMVEDANSRLLKLIAALLAGILHECCGFDG